MKAKGLIIALVVLLLAVGGYFLATGLMDKADSDKDAAFAESLLINAAPEEINKIVYSYQGVTHEFVLDSDGETWLYPADPNFPLKQRLVRKMADTVAEFTAVQQVDAEAAKNLAQYGLDAPQCVLALYTVSGDSFLVNIGNYSSLPKGYYVNLAGSEDVYVATNDLDCYLLNMAELATQDSIPFIMNTRTVDVRIQLDGEDFCYTRYDDGHPDYYNSTINWFREEADGTLIAGDNTKFREFISDLNALEVFASAHYPYSEADLSQFGLEDGGRGIITIRYRDEGSEEIKTFTLAIGGHVKEEDRDDYFRYVRINDSELICTIRAEDLDALLQGEDHFLCKDVCVVDYMDIWKMDLTVDGKEYHFTSEKEDTVDQFGYDVISSTYFLEGEEVEQEYFRVFQSGFSSIDAEAFADDGKDFADVEAYIRIEYTTDTMDGEVLEFVPYNTNFYLARFGGRSDMLVNRLDLRTALSRLDSLLESMLPEEEAPAPAA